MSVAQPIPFHRLDKASIPHHLSAALYHSTDSPPNATIILLMIPSAASRLYAMPPTATQEIKYGMYEIVCTTVLTFRLLISFTSSVNIRITGKLVPMRIREIKIVFLNATYVPVKVPPNTLLKCCQPTHSLPPTPSVSL